MLLSRALEDICGHIWIQSSATLSLNMPWGNWIPTWSRFLSSHVAVFFCTMSSGKHFPLDTYLGTFLSNRILPEWGKKESFCMQLQILKVIVFQSRYALYFITRAFQGKRLGWNSGLWLKVGLGDTRGLGDAINKQHLTFALNLQSIIFGGLEKAILCWRACK